MRDELSMPPLRKSLGNALIVAGVVFLASLFGILTRPYDFLAAFWPANALLLGVMTRYPRLASPAGWTAAVVGYFAADLITGGGFLVTLWLTVGNLTSVVTGYLLFRRRPETDLHLQSPLSVLRLFAICATASLAAAVVGSGAGPVLFEKSWVEGFWLWFATELVNSIVILPMLFTAPSFSAVRSSLIRSPAERKFPWKKAMPLLALAASVVAGSLVGGPGAIAFPIPALLWCALSYNLFTSALLTMLLCSWLMIAISAGFLHVPLMDDFMYSMTSLRLGITLLSLGPLTVASINRVQNHLLERLHDAATRDSLTRALARKAFLDRAGELLSQSVAAREPLTVLMLDIDHFKKINDRHGHAAGDKVLAAFAAAVSAALREGDVFGRLGGEEFGVVLPRTALPEALEIAGRLHRGVKTTPFPLKGGGTLPITVSIGVASQSDSAATSLEALISIADEALYQAKKSGRDQVADA